MSAALTIATTDYDLFRDFRLGLVRPEGIEANWLTLGTMRFFRVSPSTANGTCASCPLPSSRRRWHARTPTLSACRSMPRDCFASPRFMWIAKRAPKPPRICAEAHRCRSCLPMFLNCSLAVRGVAAITHSVRFIARGCPKPTPIFRMRRALEPKMQFELIR
jgi:hypothetical protein